MTLTASSAAALVSATVVVSALQAARHSFRTGVQTVAVHARGQ